MRIAFDVSYIQTRRTGIGRYSTGLLESLLSAGHEHEYILHGWSRSIDREWIMHRRSAHACIHIARIPGPIKRFYWNRFRTMPISTIIGEFDIFHSADPLLPPLGRRSSIVTIHDLAYVRHPDFFERTVLSWDARVRSNAETASAILVPSEFTRQELIEAFRLAPERIVCVPPPVSSIFTSTAGDHDAHIAARYSPDAPFLMHTGTIEPRKNIVTLVRAFDLLAGESAFRHNLMLVGRKGWKYGETIRAIASSRYRSRIHMIDFIPDTDLAALYRKADVLVYPSWYEGHGSPVVEAMASGTPVVTSRSSALAEVAGTAALLVNPADPVSICEGVSSILGNPGLRNELRGRGLQQARRFSPANAGSALLKLYNSLAPQ